MRVLILAKNHSGHWGSIQQEHANSLRYAGIDVVPYGLNGNGVYGYLTEFFRVIRLAREIQPDIILAHYGLTGLIANIQRKIPVITIFHGSDIHSGGIVLFLSKIAMSLSAHCIFVSRQLLKDAHYHNDNYSVFPMGVDLDIIKEMPKEEAKQKLNKPFKFALFAGSFSNPIKNASLALDAVKRVPNLQLLELKGYNREGVNLIMNAADCLLMTSHSEGSPQVIKEALACGTPIVSVNVGDVADIIKGIDGCFITPANVSDIAFHLQLALAFNKKTQGRKRLLERNLALQQIAERYIEIFLLVLNNSHL